MQNNSTKPLSESELAKQVCNLQGKGPHRLCECDAIAAPHCRWCHRLFSKLPQPLSGDGIGIHNDLCEICGKDAHHLVCPMKDAAPNDKPCNNCGSPVYYSWGEKLHAHEGHRPSLKHRLPTGSDWGKWTDCENPNGSKIGTKAELATVLKDGPAEGIAKDFFCIEEQCLCDKCDIQCVYCAEQAAEPASPVAQPNDEIVQRGDGDKNDPKGCIHCGLRIEQHHLFDITNPKPFCVGQGGRIYITHTFAPKASHPTPIVAPEKCKHCELPEDKHGKGFYGRRFCADEATEFEAVDFDKQRHARIICDDTGCGEWNCDDCHPETKFSNQLAPVVVSVEGTRLFPPLGDRSLHFEDSQVLANVKDSYYAKTSIKHHLMHMTCNEKWSLYRAIVSLSAHPSPLPEPLVSNEDLAFTTAVCQGGRVDRACIELQQWRKWGKENAK